MIFQFQLASITYLETYTEVTCSLSLKVIFIILILQFKLFLKIVLSFGPVIGLVQSKQKHYVGSVQVTQPINQSFHSRSHVYHAITNLIPLSPFGICPWNSLNAITA